MNRFYFCMQALGLSALAATALPGAWAADLSVNEIVAKNVAARGGLEAWRAVSSLRLSGEIDAGGKQGVRLPFVWSMKRPHLSRLEIAFQDKTAVQAYDGHLGWKLRPFLNRDDVEPYSRQEAQSAAAAAELDGPLLDHARKGTQVALLGMEAVEGKPSYKLRLTPQSGPAFNLWLDASSFLERKIDGEPRKIDGRVHPVAIYYRDYQKVEGLNLAHTLETVVEGVASSHTISLHSVKVNPTLPDALFALRSGNGSSDNQN